jgi:4-hydroxy-tetrahydrodipicolinate reductase
MARQPIELIVCGAAGRMGRRIVAMACEDPRFRIAGAIEVAGNSAVGKDAGANAGIGQLGVAIGSDLRRALRSGSVIVDFTSADASLAHLEIAAGHKNAIVVGSTGFSPQQRDKAEALARSMPTLIAPNMSLGVNVLVSLVEDAVRRLGPDFDCEIFEVHHNRKKDSPSGTALALAEAAARGAGLAAREAVLTAREGPRRRTPQEGDRRVRAARRRRRGRSHRHAAGHRRAHRAHASCSLARLPRHRRATRSRVDRGQAGRSLFDARRRLRHLTATFRSGAARSVRRNTPASS